MNFIFNFLLSFLFLFPIKVSADVVPPNHHVFERCVKIVNLYDYPDIVLIGYYKDVMRGGYQIYQIENNKCLTKGYKANIFKIYWNEKDKVNVIESNKLLTDKIEPYGYPIPDDNPLIKEIIEYSLGVKDDGKPFLYQQKKISEYRDKKSQKIETYPNPLKRVLPTESKPKTKRIILPPTVDQRENNQSTNNFPPLLIREFWHSLVCFIYGIVGKNCF